MGADEYFSGERVVKEFLMGVPGDLGDRVKAFATEQGLSQKKAAAHLLEVGLRGNNPQPDERIAALTKALAEETERANAAELALTQRDEDLATLEAMVDRQAGESGWSWPVDAFSGVLTAVIPVPEAKVEGCRCDGLASPGSWHKLGCQNYDPEILP